MAWSTEMGSALRTAWTMSKVAPPEVVLSAAVALGLVASVPMGAFQLVAEVADDRVEDAEAVHYALGRSGQVDDEGGSRGAGVAAAKQRGRRLGGADGPQPLHDAGDLAVQQRQGLFRGGIGGAEAGAPAGNDHRGALAEQGAQGGADRFAV